MSNHADDLVVASDGHIWIANVGTTLPALNSDPKAAPAAGFYDLGYITEDGVSPTSTPTVTDFRAWQSLQSVRRERTAQDFEVKFSLEEWNRHSVVFAFGGGTVSSAAGFQTYTFPAAGDALDERSMLIDWSDGAKNYRLVCPRGNVTDAVATQFKRAELAVLPVTFKALQATDGTPIYMITDDPAWDSAS